jgi:hypothetical protein
MKLLRTKLLTALCFLMYDQVRGLNNERQISIEGLQEDEQG